MNPFFGLMLLAISFLPGCAAQNAGGIKSGYAFFRKQTPGNIQVRDGIAVKRNDTIRYIFLEVKDSIGPGIDTVIWKTDVYWDIPVLRANKLPVKTDAKETARKGYSFWQILIPELVSATVNQATEQDKIIIKGRSNDKPFVFIINRETELAQLIAQ